MANLYLIIATSLWGLNFHFAGLILPEAHFLEGGFWRYLFGCVFLGLIAARGLPSWELIRANIRGIISVGGVALFLFNIFFFWGMRDTSGVNGALIQGLNPALTLILSHFLLKTEIKFSHILGIIIAFVGVLFLMLQGDFSRVLELRFSQGDLIVFIAVNFFALHHVWVKKYSNAEFKDTSFTLMAAIACFIGFVFCLPFSDFQAVDSHSTRFWVGVVGIGILGSGVSYILWYKGVHMVGANRAGVYVNLVPLSAGLSASLFGESLEVYHLISGAMIISGLLVMQSSQWRQSR